MQDRIIPDWIQHDRVEIGGKRDCFYFFESNFFVDSMYILSSKFKRKNINPLKKKLQEWEH